MGHSPAHGDQQSEVVYLLKTLLPQGRVVTGCPLSTSDGIKAIDVAWLTEGRRQEVRSMTCLLQVPEICVEVLYPSNTSEEIPEKIALYFESGAKEVWLCDRGTLEFRFSDPPEIRPSSGICPDSPPHIDL
jgi:Uma2 family endonuclease